MKTIVLAIMFALTFAAKSTSFEYSYPAEAGQQLELNSLQGDFDVQQGEDGNIRIQETIRWRGSKASTEKNGEFSESGTDIRFQQKKKINRNSWVLYEIFIPSGVDLAINNCTGDVLINDVDGRILLDILGGDISIEHASSAEILANTKGGDLNLLHCEAPLNCKTGGGDIHADGHTGNISVECAGGDVLIRRFTGDVDVKNMGGESFVISGSGNRVSIDNSSGDILVENVDADSIQLFNKSGDVTVQNVAGELSLEQMNGEFVCRNYLGDLSMSSFNGEVEVYGARGSLQVELKNGEVDIYDFSPECGDSSFVKVDNGDIEVEMDSGDYRILAQTWSGEIEANFGSGKGWLPKKLEFESGKADCKFEISTRSGDIDISVEGDDAK